MQKFTTFLMFVGDQYGKAEEAMNLYVTVFENSRIISIQRYGPGEDEREGAVRHAVFDLNGQEFMAIDSGHEHHFSFTPAISIFVQCADEPELLRAFERLSDGGAELMPLGDYGFSRKFGWIADRFGVSWQLNLA
ncbi:MAG TPA: VOC family protein [Candidatus Paceibacterota bacterium]|nr:VOC family protein [Candidatus Paceibacterota bacterium]